jgi:hypothetical protein
MSEKPTLNDHIDNVRRQLENSVALVSMYLFIALLTSLAALGMYCLYNVATHDHKHDYCFLEVSDYNSNIIVLYAHRPWQASSRIGTFVNVDEALVAAKKINCQISTAEVK